MACPRQSIGSGSGSSPVPWLSGFSYAMQRTNNSSATLFEEEQHCPLDGLAFRLAHVGRQSQGGPARPLGSVASVDQAARVCGRGIGRLLLQAGGVVSHSSGSRPRGRVPGQLAGHRSLMWRSRRRSSPAPQRILAECDRRLCRDPGACVTSDRLAAPLPPQRAAAASSRLWSGRTLVPACCR